MVGILSLWNKPDLSFSEKSKKTGLGDYDVAYASIRICIQTTSVYGSAIRYTWIYCTYLNTMHLGNKQGLGNETDVIYEFHTKIGKIVPILYRQEITETASN